jgi:AcrR family transcriptional regulator
MPKASAAASRVTSHKSDEKTDAGPARMQEVLDAAARLFHEKGYRSTSLADIGQVLGMNKASLYYYVRSKEDLAKQLILRASRTLRDVSSSLEIDNLDPPQALERLVREHCAVILSYPNEFGLLIQQRRFVEPQALGEINERERVYVSHVRAVIARGMEQGFFRKADVGVATSLALHAVNSLLSWYRPAGRLPASAATDATWAFVLGGLAQQRTRQKRT